MRLSGLCFLLLFFLSSVLWAGSVKDFLKEQKIIRVYVDSAPGFGHQSAGISVMSRLKELGFHGQFEVVYQPAVATKIQRIFPGFPEGIKNFVQYIDIEQYKNLRQAGEIAQVHLAISGADDGFGEKFAAIANANHYLRLQPLGWGLPTLYGDQPVRLSAMDSLPLANVRSLEPQKILEILATDQTLNEDKKKFVEKFMLLSGEHLTFPIYGVGIQAYAPQRMYFYMKALRSAIEKMDDKKAVVVPVVSPFNAQEMDSVLKIFGKKSGFEAATPYERSIQRKIHILNPQSFNQLEEVRAGNIYLVFVGSVPQPVFNYFYERAQLPVWVAGKNALSFALGKGKPYFNTVNDYVLPGGDLLSESSQKILSRAYTAFSVGYQEFSNQGRLRDVSRYIIESSTPGSELNEFFTRVGVEMSATDRVLEGLRTLLGESGSRSCQQLF